MYRKKIGKVLSALTIILLSIEGCSQNPDIDLLKKFNVDRNKNLDGTFEFITYSAPVLTIAVPVGTLIYAIMKKDSVRKSNAILICSSQIVAGIITTSMKLAINRDRPYETYYFIQHIGPGGGSSFPSGHTSSAFALATSLSMTYPKWYVITGSFVWATAVGYSRMDLGVHYPSDVIAGAIVGSGSAFLSKKLTRWINSKNRNSRKFH
jgi:membrane-associated phospholipid phosphatase